MMRINAWLKVDVFMCRATMEEDDGLVTLCTICFKKHNKSTNAIMDVSNHVCIQN